MICFVDTAKKATRPLYQLGTEAMAFSCHIYQFEILFGFTVFHKLSFSTWTMAVFQ